MVGKWERNSKAGSRGSGAGDWHFSSSEVGVGDDAGVTDPAAVEGNVDPVGHGGPAIRDLCGRGEEKTVGAVGVGKAAGGHKADEAKIG